MNRTKAPTAIFLIFLLLSFVSPSYSQRQRPRPRPAPRPVAQPAPSFDTLLSSDSYKIYVEIRNVGQVLSSSSVTELLEPVMKFAAPPKEFRTAVKWLMSHSEPIMTSRLMLATWPTSKNIPDVLIAIEFDNPEEASKFEPELNEFLPKLIPPTAPKPEASPAAESARKDQPAAKSAPPAEPKPAFAISRAGSLVFISNTPLVLKNLRPANRKALTEDQNFRMAHDRFNTDPVFVFLNMKAIEREEEEQRQKAIEDRKTRVEIVENEQKTEPQEPEAVPPPEVIAPTTELRTGTIVGEAHETQSMPDPISLGMMQLAGAFFGGPNETRWPEAIGFGASLDAASFDVRALLVNPPAEKIDAIPFLPFLISGPAIVPESPSILPADTELFVVMSLDLPQMYSFVNKRATAALAGPIVGRAGPGMIVSEVQPQLPPFEAIEKKLGLKFQTDVLPLIGNEIVVSMPVDDPEPSPSPSPSPEPGAMVSVGPYGARGPNPVIAISLRDKEAMRVLLPKIIDGLVFNGASRLAQTEKRGDAEIVTYANVLSYAFIGNFLIGSPDAKAVRHVVDSYLKHETLASDNNFKNFTRWQPRQLQGQVYISPALMESYKSWASEPSTLISDQTREMLTRLSVIAEPVTYSLSNEGTGPLHQLRIPKNLVLMAVAGFSGESNPSPMISNERATIGALYTIAYAQSTIKAEKGSYASLDELIAQQKISREVLENHGYKIYMTTTANSFEVVAVPAEYGKTGKSSYFVNETHIVRSGDHGGAPASVSDKPIQ